MASVEAASTTTPTPTTTTASSAAPQVTITPASPTNTTQSTVPTPIQPSTSTVPNATDADAHMKEKAPTDSETALLAKGGPAGASSTSAAEEKKVRSSSPSPLETLTRKLSGKAASRSEVSTKPATAAAPGSVEKTTPTTTKPAATSTSAPVASTSRSTPSTSQGTRGPATTNKKKKRKGLAGFFAALGCLSTNDIDDAPRPATAASSTTGTKDMAQKPGTGVTKPAATTTTTTATTSAAPTGDAAVPSTNAGATGGETAGSVPVDSSRQPGASGVATTNAVALAPVEPAHAPLDETAGVTSSAVQTPGSGSELLSTPHRPGAVRRESDTTPSQQATSSAERTETSGGYTDISDSEARTGDENAAPIVDEQEYGMDEEYEDEEDRLIAQGGMGIPLDENGHPAPLLPVMDKVHQGRKCLVLDLDETLLHSSFKMLPSADYIVPVEIESQVHNVYVIKRPGVDHFLTEMGKIYEVVVFTASLSKYADPVLDMLDPAGVVRHRLFRESCYNHKGNYVKDLSQLGRDMEGCIIIDNSPASYIFHPNNAVPVSTWFNDPHDTELTDLCPFLTDLATVDDIRGVLDGSI